MIPYPHWVLLINYRVILYLNINNVYSLYGICVYLMAKERTSKIFIFFLLMKLNWILEFFFSHSFLIAHEADSKILLGNKTINKKTLLISRSFSCLEWLKTKINVSLKTWLKKNWINKASSSAATTQQNHLSQMAVFTSFIYKLQDLAKIKLPRGGKKEMNVQ